MDIETELLLLKQDVGRITSFSEKLDSAIERWGDVSSDIARMLAVHEERLNKQDQLDEELFSLLEKRRLEMQDDIKDLHSRISTVSRELSSDMSEVEQRLMTAMTYGMTDLKKCLTEDHRNLTEDRKELEKRVTELERWRWIVLGGSIVFASFSNQIFNFLFKIQ